MAAKNNDIEGAVAGELEEFDPASLLGRGRGARKRSGQQAEETAPRAETEQESARASHRASSREGGRKKAPAIQDKAARAKTASARGSRDRAARQGKTGAEPGTGRGKKRRRVYVGEIVIGETD